jgi:hypothetical protein
MIIWNKNYPHHHFNKTLFKTHSHKNKTSNAKYYYKNNSKKKNPYSFFVKEDLTATKTNTTNATMLNKTVTNKTNRMIIWNKNYPHHHFNKTLFKTHSHKNKTSNAKYYYKNNSKKKNPYSFFVKEDLTATKTNTTNAKVEIQINPLNATIVNQIISFKNKNELDAKGSSDIVSPQTNDAHPKNKLTQFFIEKIRKNKLENENFFSKEKNVESGHEINSLTSFFLEKIRKNQMANKNYVNNYRLKNANTEIQSDSLKSNSNSDSNSIFLEKNSFFGSMIESLTKLSKGIALIQIGTDARTEMEVALTRIDEKLNNISTYKQKMEFLDKTMSEVSILENNLKIANNELLDSYKDSNNSCKKRIEELNYKRKEAKQSYVHSKFNLEQFKSKLIYLKIRKIIN